MSHTGPSAKHRSRSVVITDDTLKTAEMLRLELRYQVDIAVLLSPNRGTGRVLAEKYGVSESVISRWRKRLGIRVEQGGWRHSQRQRKQIPEDLL